MDLLHALETFVRVVETGSFSAVAREGNINTSAVTRLGGQLEEHFRGAAVPSHHPPFGPDRRGADLLSHAHDVIDAAAGLEDSPGRQRSAPTGRVRVGVTAGGGRLVTPGLGDLLDRYLGLTVDLMVREHFDDLIEDRLDLAVRVGSPMDASLVAQSVGGFGRTLVAAPDYLAAHGDPEVPADLERFRCIVHDSGPGSARWRFNGPGGPYEIEVVGGLTATTSNVVRQSALAGHGIALLSEPLVHEDIRGGRLRRLLPEYPTDFSQLFLIYLSRRHLAPRTRVVIDFVIEQFKTESERFG